MSVFDERIPTSSTGHDGFIRFVPPFLMASGSAGVGLAAVLLSIQRLDASAFELGISAGILQIATIIFSWIMGRLVDRVGHRTLPIISGVIYGLLTLLLSRVSSMTQVYILMMGFGASLGAFWPSMEASFGENAHGKVLLRRVGFFNLSWSSGVALGPLIAGTLFASSEAFAFYALAVIAVAAGVVVLLIRPGSAHEGNSPLANGGNAVEKKDNHYLYAAWVSNFGAWFVVGVLRAIFPKLAESLALSGRQIGFLLFLWALAMGTMFWILSRSTWWNYRSLPLQISQGVLIAGCLVIYGVSTMSLLMLGVMLIGIGCGLTYTSSLFYALDGYEDKGAKSGIHEVVLGTGTMIGPPLCGLAAEHFTLRTPYSICATVIFLCMVVVALLLRGQGNCPDRG